MKKIISLITAAALSISCMAAASAARIQSLSEALDKDEIHIIYNDTAVEYEDAKPINTEGRVMIPFRAALETMNATVDYDEETKTVTATKGDTTIKFTLLDDTIYIDNNGEQSTITMDVPMLVEGDRTYVPVRFMSNALGMQVGWNGDNETVVIMDYDEYLQQIEEKIPNLKKLASYDTTKFNKCSIDMSIDGSAETFVGCTAVLNALMKDGKIGADGKIKFTSSTFNLDESEINVVLDGTTLYFKTNILENLEKLNSSAAFLQLMTADGTEWFSVDLAKLGVDTQAIEMLEMIASGQVPDTEAYFKNYMLTEGDVQYMTAIILASTADMLEYIDSKLVIEEKEDGYTVSIDITPEDYAQFLGNPFDAPQLSIKARTDVTGDTMTAEIEAAMSDGFNNGVTIKMNETAEVAGEDETVTVPEKSKDITALLSFPTPTIPIGQ